ncbi:gustatory receptor for sugar taste 43a-like [Cylas formicarius]|uniref:gustatory receptor for sugar taste 43a-like n=1 Tax=Cylas formicarius TaxID=197179 RepID=UPI002958730C|nr:gustatory receptor for sugar taste 43a-like [Cylas formicarius]
MDQRFAQHVFFFLDFLTPANVRKLIEIYDGIFDATVAVNRFYSITLPVSVLNCIICLIITPFVLYQQLISVNVEKFVYTQSFWMTCHVLRLLLMIEPCHYCKEEEKDIRRLVLKLMNVGFGKEVQTQMKLLWINLFENNIDIGPGHFATLSRGLIPTISASATTYLIVLFQSRSSK